MKLFRRERWCWSNGPSAPARDCLKITCRSISTTCPTIRHAEFFWQDNSNHKLKTTSRQPAAFSLRPRAYRELRTSSEQPPESGQPLAGSFQFVVTHSVFNVRKKCEQR